MSGSFIGGVIAPGKPHLLLAPEKNKGWQSLRNSYERVRQDIELQKPDLLVLYSTQWPSIIGHQIQADPAPRWHLVDPDFHQLGTVHYDLRMDPHFASAYESAALARGLTARTVAYHGFPVDMGSVVALKLLNPDNAIPACVVSCNMYSDRGETLVLGKAARDAVTQTGRRAMAIAVTALSNRMWTDWIDPKDDAIHSPKDDEWNQKLLELLGEGRLEDVSQLARQFSSQANGDSRLRALWWLGACLGQHNNFRGTVYDYQPIWGTGAALVGLLPEESQGITFEYDEDNQERFLGERNVIVSK